MIERKVMDTMYEMLGACGYPKFTKNAELFIRHVRITNVWVASLFHSVLSGSPGDISGLSRKKVKFDLSQNFRDIDDFILHVSIVLICVDNRSDSSYVSSTLSNLAKHTFNQY